MISSLMLKILLLITVYFYITICRWFMGDLSRYSSAGACTQRTGKGLGEQQESRYGYGSHTGAGGLFRLRVLGKFFEQKYGNQVGPGALSVGCILEFGAVPSSLNWQSQIGLLPTPDTSKTRAVIFIYFILTIFCTTYGIRFTTVFVR